MAGHPIPCTTVAADVRGKKRRRPRPVQTASINVKANAGLLRCTGSLSGSRLMSMPRKLARKPLDGGYLKAQPQILDSPGEIRGAEQIPRFRGKLVNAGQQLRRRLRAASASTEAFLAASVSSGI